jgi:diguanylate cyclase (GGDEF)-like protein
MALVRDISERVRAREELEHQAFFDALTELPNRSLLQDRLRQALAASRRTGEPVALLLLDLNRFKEVNDTFGHAAGDVLLREVAIRLKKEFRETDTLSRLGGDEFSIVLPGNDATAAQMAARRIIRTLEQPIVVQGQSMEVGASIGIALSPEHGTDPDALLRHADVAMYAAKRQGLGFSLYEPSHDQSSAARLTMTAELRQAIEEHQLVLHYQPQVDVASSHIVGVEALVRWEHPTRGVLPPSEFIPLAEETGLIRPLLTSVLHLALDQSRRIQTTHPDLVMAVNISMRNLVDPGLPDLIERLMVEAGVPAGLLELELTESAIMTDAQRAIEILGRLRSLGVRLTIDDFGTGHSSLAYLHRLPLNCVKIDKSFVTHLRRDESSAAIVRSTIELAHNLKFAVVAEGVEDGAVLDYLAELGCDVAQGYYISRALAADALPSWLQQHAH